MLKPALMFRNHMILQRDKKVRIWGTAEPGESLVITVQGTEASCTADPAGNWSALIGPLKTSFGETLTVCGASEKLPPGHEQGLRRDGRARGGPDARRCGDEK